MTKVTLTIETERDEDPRQALARFLGIDPDKVGPAAANGSPVVDWTPDDFTGLWNGLTADAKALLGEYAKKPEGCSAADIEKALGWTGLQIAGRMSSIGHQMRRYPKRPYPVTRNAVGDYTVTRRIADWITRLATGRKAA